MQMDFYEEAIHNGSHGSYDWEDWSGGRTVLNHSIPTCLRNLERQINKYKWLINDNNVKAAKIKFGQISWQLFLLWQGDTPLKLELMQAVDECMSKKRQQIRSRIVQDELAFKCWEISNK